MAIVPPMTATSSELQPTVAVAIENNAATPASVLAVWTANDFTEVVANIESPLDFFDTASTSGGGALAQVSNRRTTRSTNA
jgi:hypothetical protein